MKKIVEISEKSEMKNKIEYFEKFFGKMKYTDLTMRNMGYTYLRVKHKNLLVDITNIDYSKIGLDYEKNIRIVTPKRDIIYTIYYDSNLQINNWKKSTTVYNKIL